MLVRPDSVCCVDRLRRIGMVLPAALSMLLPAMSGAVDIGLRCEIVAAKQLRSCVRLVNRATNRCYKETGSACSTSDPRVISALVSMQTRVGKRCSDAAAVQSAGYGALMAPSDLQERLREACLGEAAALAARSFGGPHAAALNGTNDDGRRCLLNAHNQGARLLFTVGRLRDACVRRQRSAGSCDGAATEARITKIVAKSEVSINRRCPSGLNPLVALTAATFAGRTEAQARCLAAVSHPDPSPQALACGPRPEVPVPPRAVTTQIILPESEWGTRCGDGSSYAFLIRPAPLGSPIENVVVFMQGGGVCVLEDDCAGVSSGLMRATDNTTMPTGGFLSSSAATNPFRDWTKVYLPYCTQDIHAGGGTTSNFPSRTVHRFGAINVRTALRYVRDVIWADLDANTAAGYRPDRPRVILSGGSAGGFGTSLNYHYVLDDLRWSHTTAAPDSSLGLNSGGAFSIATLGNLMLSTTAPLGWGSREYLPPYCFAAGCAVIPTMHAAHSPRLKAVPEQQLINVSNQVDDVQESTTFFPSRVSWINAMRTAYCASQGMNGIFSFLPASNSSIHGILDASRFDTLTVDGVVARDFLGAAMASPNSVVDRVEEGTIAATFGAIAFPCSVD